MVRQAAVAVIVFAIASVAGVLIARTGDSADAITSTTIPLASTSTTAPQVIFAAEGETILGPAALVAGEPYLEGTQLVIPFDVANLAPTADAADVFTFLQFGNSLITPPEDIDAVYLDRWLLHTTNDEIPGSTANPSARAARFEVGEGFDIASIEAVTLPSYSLFIPVESEISLSVGNESATISPGLTIRLLAVTEQANTIIQIEARSERDFNLGNLRISGAGPGWLSAVKEAEGRPRWNLTYDAETAPSPITALVEGAVWVTVDRPIEVVLPEGS